MASSPAAPDAPDRSSLARGAMLGSWRVEGWLGRGGMGAVYRATADSGAVAALKVISRELATDARFVERFRREAALAARVRDRHVVASLGHGETGGRLWLALELVPGGSLADRLERAGPLPAGEVARLGAGIARGLAALHAHGIVHRDLKPANVLLGADGAPRVSDFGLARGGGTAALTRTGELLGTVEYMAPELAEGGNVVDGRSDLYSLGCTLYALLVGEPPFPGSGPATIAKHLRAKPDPVARRAPETPAALARIVHTLLAKNPADRGGEAADVALALERLAGVTVGGRARGAGPWTLAAAGTATLLALAAIGTLRGRSGPEASPARPGPSEPATLPAPTPPGASALASPAPSPPPWYLALSPAARPELPLPPGLGFSEVPGEYVHERDRSVLVYVPGGRFRMGRPEDTPPRPEGKQRSYGDEEPAHEVVLSPYFLGRDEVSNAQFERFTNASGYETDVESGRTVGCVRRLPGLDLEGKPDEQPDPGATWRVPDGSGSRKPSDRAPVVQVTWNDASAYVAWAGLRLPSEAEWERAAGWERGEPGRARLYPWSSASETVGAGSRPNHWVMDVGSKVDRELRRPVDEPSADLSPVGARNMGGNVSEWVVDVYDGEAYGREAGATDPCRVLAPPHFTSVMFRRTYRGGSYRDVEYDCRCAVRNPGRSFQGTRPRAEGAVGFRVALSAGPPRSWEPASDALARAALARRPAPYRLPEGVKFGDRPGEYRNRDGTTLVFVAPGEVEVPAQGGDRKVQVSGFFLAARPVSRAQLARFRAGAPPDAAVEPPRGGAPGEDGEAPATGLGEAEARAYARWAGFRLPTEAEWLRALGRARPAGRRPARRPGSEWGCLPAPGTRAELCLDRFDEAPDPAATDPVVTTGIPGSRVLRAGDRRAALGAQDPTDRVTFRLAASEDGSERAE